jgi:phosphate transport system substrate-binding protein
MTDRLRATRLTRAQFLRSAAVAAAVLAAPSLVRPAQAAEPLTILETGSSLLYPLFNLWVAGYQKISPGLRVTTQSTGSGTGIAQAVAGIAQIGASDAYVANPVMKKHPDMLNIPLAISAQNVVYNLPGMTAHLKLSGPVLAGIYGGKITKWNDAAIAAINPGVTLPDHGIIPIHRTDGSGDTFIFTQYLSFSTPDWLNSIAYGTTVSWPAVQGGIGAIGNPGMVQTTQQNPYAISYIGVSFAAQIATAGLGTAMLQNKDGNFVLPTPETISAAAEGQVAKTPKDQRISLIFSPGAQAYPIINYEYAVVNRKQSSAAMAKAIRGLLDWAIEPTGGSAASYLDQVHFIALPEPVRKMSSAQIRHISS